LVALALDVGLRKGEIARLDDADVSITVGAGHVRVSAGKAAMSCEVPLRAQTRSLLTAWREHRVQASRGLRDPALFVGPEGQRLSARSVDRVIREAGRAAGLEVSPSTLRHTYATNLARADGSPAMIARLLGHAQVDLTRHCTAPPYGSDCAETARGSERCTAASDCRARRQPGH
jgi:site-specific recombinase XerC